MPSSGTPTAQLTGILPQIEGGAGSPVGLVAQRSIPVPGLAAKIAQAREDLCSCRQHLLSANDRTGSVQRLIGQVEGLIGLSETITTLDQDLGGSLAAIAHNRNAQVAHALADLTGLAEEIGSAEDLTLTEILADALSFALHRMGDYSYVLSARSAARGGLGKIRPHLEQELVDLLEQRQLAEADAAARGFCDALFSPTRRPEELGPIALVVLAAIFRAKCALFVERLDGLLQEKHGGGGK